MKKLLIIILALFAITTHSEIIRKGNTFQQIEQPTLSEIPTFYTWKDKDGKTYPIYISKNGACYIKKISKSGKEYKKYLPKEIQRQIKYELGR